MRSARACVRAHWRANLIVVAMCGSAFKNKGVQAMLDAVIDYMPSPIDVPSIARVSMRMTSEAERHADDKEPFAALAFKIATDPFVGSLTFFRVYSGVLNSGDTIYNPVKRPQRTHWSNPADAFERSQRDQGSSRRRYRGRGRA